MDQTAEILVEIADKNYLRGDKTAYFSILTGANGCKLENIPGSGQDYQTIIDTIHSYYRKHPSLDIIEGYQTGLNIQTYHLESIWNNYADKVKEKYEIII